jgi:hypothetical protein
MMDESGQQGPVRGTASRAAQDGKEAIAPLAPDESRIILAFDLEACPSGNNGRL